MDAQEMKTRIKDAREAIRNKDFTTALKHAEAVLNHDEDNYNALVFLGAAAQEVNEYEKAERSFRKAVKIQPKSILAWQGWRAFCEKSLNPSHKEELINIYNKLLELQGDIEKKFELAGKLAQLYLEKNEIQKSVQVLRNQYEFAEESTLKENKIDQALAKVLSSQQTLSEENQILLKSSLIKIFSSDCELVIEDKKLFLIQYVKFLLKDADAKLCLNEATKLLNLDPLMIYPYEVICNLYINAVARLKELKIDNIKEIIEKLLNLDANNHVANIAQITVNYIDNEKESLIISLGKINTGETVEECCILLRSTELLHQYQKSVQFAELGFSRCNKFSKEEDTFLAVKFQLGLINAQLHIATREVIEQNVSTLENMLIASKTDIEITKTLILSYFKIDNVEAAFKLCGKLSSCEQNSNLADGYLGMVLRRENKFREACLKLEKAVNNFPNESVFMLELALVLRELNELPKSLLTLLMALKQDSFNPSLFYQIGLHYVLQKDLVKAQRCLKKSFLINPDNEDVAIALSDLYAELDMQEENIELLSKVTSAERSSNKWALVRLGFCYYKLQNLNAAIKVLQKALSIDNRDSHCWEYLADCYMHRGSNTAALKSYASALELNPDSIYCRYRIAEISQLLHDYENSIVEYEYVLKKEPTYIPAIKGLGMVKLLQAEYYFQESLPGLMRESCAKAIETFAMAIVLQPNLSCLWKLFGDACTFTNRVPSELCMFTIPEEFVKLSGLKTTSFSKRELLNLGARCYKQALSLHESANVWHDIGTNYHFQAWISPCEQEKMKFYHNSLLAFKKAIMLDSQNFIYWNALGIVAVRIKNFVLAQHAFISSIKIEDQNPDAWTYLGLIYLLHNNVQLAHKAFAVAQILDPSYMTCWIGMATIAETMGNLEAMDLFRHTTTLGYHDESALGYAHWVVQTLLDESLERHIKVKFWQANMASIPTPSDCMVKYSGHVQDDAQALNTLGILLEREKLYMQASAAFEKAIRLLQKTDDIDKMDIVRSNYARVLCHRGKDKLSAEQFLLVKNPDFYSQCGLALVYYKNDLLEESLQAYEAAIHWFAKNDNEKSNVYVAMAAVAYRMKNIDVAKAFLFQSFQLQPPSVHGIFSLCAIGLLISDSNLIEAAMKEMLPYLKNQEYLSTITSLFCFTMLLQGRVKDAQRIVCKAIHEFPAKDDLWFILSRVLLQFLCDKPKVIDKCLSVLLARHNLKSPDVSITKVVNYRNLVHLANGYGSDCVKSAQKAVRVNPNDLTNWACLLASVVMQDGCYQKTIKKEWFLKTLNYIQKQFSATGNTKLNEWLRSYQSLITLCSQPDDKQALKRNLQSGRGNDILQWLSDNKTEPNVDELWQIVKKDPKFNFGWQCLAKVYSALGKYEDMVEVLSLWTVYAEENCLPQTKTVAIATLYAQTLELYQMSSDEKWLHKTKEIELQLGNLIWSNNVMKFLQAKKYFLAKDKHKMKIKLNEILKLPELNNYNWVDETARKILNVKKKESSDKSLSVNEN